MTLYLIAGGAVFLTAALMGVLIFAYHAGRNNARVKDDQTDIADANQTAQAAQRMNEVQTNGIRSDNQLLDVLNKGKF